MAQVVCRQPVTTKTRVHSSVTPCERLFVDEVESGQIFLQEDYFGFSLSVSFHRSPYPHSSTCCLYQRDEWDDPGNLPKKTALFQESESFGLRTFIYFPFLRWEGFRIVLYWVVCVAGFQAQALWALEPAIIGQLLFSILLLLTSRIFKTHEPTWVMT